MARSNNPYGSEPRAVTDIRAALGSGSPGIGQGASNINQSAAVNAQVAQTQMQQWGFQANRELEAKLEQSRQRSAMLRDMMKLMNDSVFQALGYGVQKESLAIQRQNAENERLYQSALATESGARTAASTEATRQSSEVYNSLKMDVLPALGENLRRSRADQYGGRGESY